MTLKEMVEEYNKLTGKSVKKFSSRAAGEKRLFEARAEFASKIGTNKSLSESIKNSWNNKKVAQKRAQRNGCVVDGEHEYKSVRAAFVDLGLPLNGHVKFRMNLKAEGKGEFSGHKFKLA